MFKKEQCISVKKFLVFLMVLFFIMAVPLTSFAYSYTFNFDLSYSGGDIQQQSQDLSLEQGNNVLIFDKIYSSGGYVKVEIINSSTNDVLRTYRIHADYRVGFWVPADDNYFIRVTLLSPPTPQSFQGSITIVK